MWIYSDNGATFIKATKWIRSLRKDERLQGYLLDHKIQWQFNLSRAPWWGGQLERLIGVVKQAMYKNIGGANLSWNKLSKVILNVQIQINRRPLSCIEDDIEMPVLTHHRSYFKDQIWCPNQNQGEMRTRTSGREPSTKNRVKICYGGDGRKNNSQP